MAGSISDALKKAASNGGDAKAPSVSVADTKSLTANSSSGLK